MSSNYQSFETDRLLLRPTDETDAAFVHQLLNTRKWIRFIGDRKVHSPAAAKGYIQDRMLPQLERLGYSSYTIIRKSDGVKLGTCGLYDREGLEGLDIGFALLPDYEGQGYAFESANKIKEVAVQVFGINTINAITTKDNFSSQRLLERLGLVFKKTVVIKGDDEELLFYSWASR